MARNTDEEDAIDRLYQLPLGEFTSERNTLAKQLGGDAGKRVKALQKPSTAAWAVNQLYWHDRRAYDALVAASEQVRAAHKSVLGGRKADLRKADAQHRDALKGALTSTLHLVAEAGQNVSSATHTEISRTLESLPSTEPPGRLTGALQPGGFEALQGFSIQARPAKESPARETTAGTRTARQKEEEDEAALEQARKEAERALEAAKRQHQRDREAVFQLRKKVAAAEEASDDANAAWERAEKAAARLREELNEAEEALERSTSEIEALRQAT